jgi:hypothetical protein
MPKGGDGFIYCGMRVGMRMGMRVGMRMGMTVGWTRGLGGMQEWGAIR